MGELDVVIPTIKDEVRTLESIPDHVRVLIERDGSLNEARNRGIRRAESEIVAIMDDDIAFPEGTLEKLAAQASDNTLLGMKDWDFDLVAGRVMIFHKSLWREVGGFDERLGSHMGDTEFALKAEKYGYEIEQLPRTMFDHEEHERSITTWDRVWRMIYLASKYQKSIPRLVWGTLS